MNLFIIIIFCVLFLLLYVFVAGLVDSLTNWDARIKFANDKNAYDIMLFLSLMNTLRFLWPLIPIVIIFSGVCIFLDWVYRLGSGDR